MMAPIIGLTHADDADIISGMSYRSDSDDEGNEPTSTFVFVAFTSPVLTCLDNNVHKQQSILILISFMKQC